MYYNRITEFIFQEDLPQKADFIFIPGSGYGELAEKAAELYHQGYAKKIIASGKYSILNKRFEGAVSPKKYCGRSYETESDFLKAVLLDCNVNENDIIQEKQSTFTFENAIYSRILLEKDTDVNQCIPEKAILVCQAFHAARSRMYFEYIFPETEFLVCPAITQGISKENWMKNEKGRKIVLGEMERIGTQFLDIMGERDQAEKKCREIAAVSKIQQPDIRTGNKE